VGYLNNLAAEGLEKECDACIAKGIRNIVLNLNGIEMINSIGISILLGIIEKVKGTDGTLCFTNLSKLHADTFQMLGLARYMQVFATDEDAVAHLQGR
jgi:anti-anti-sigma factor